MRLLISGSRNYHDYEGFKRGLREALGPEEFSKSHTIIEGGARGVDAMARSYAREWRWEHITFPAQWALEGKAAGPIRNKRMLVEGKPDLVVAFLAKDSRGTANMVAQARKAGVEVRVIEI